MFYTRNTELLESVFSGRTLVTLLNHICMNKMNVGVELRNCFAFKLDVSLTSKQMQAIVMSVDGGDTGGWTTLPMVGS
jgi:hypothetical protein